MQSLSTRFSEIDEKTSNTEIEQETNMLPSFESLSQLSLSSNMAEIIFKETLEVSSDD